MTTSIATRLPDASAKSPDVDEHAARGLLPRVPAVWVAFSAAVGVILPLPSLAGPFQGDDYLILALLNGLRVSEGRPLELYRFASGVLGDLKRLVSEGWFPWWTDPFLKIAFFRPVSSLLIVAEHWAFGDNPFG